MTACEELINQFSDGSIKKRGRKKKPLIDDSSQEDDDEAVTPKKKIFKEKKSEPEDVKFENKDSSIVEEKPFIPAAVIHSADKTKKSKAVEEVQSTVPIEKVSSKGIRIKTEKTDKEELETVEDEKIHYERKSTKEMAEKEAQRGQRSNVSTTRIRIQNLLEDSSDTDENPNEKMVTKKPRTLKLKKVTKALKKKLSQKKKKMMKKQKKKNKIVASKKMKKVDGKREQMRHMILRRMETRKSKLDAIKSLRKSKTESSHLSDDSQPIMTRKMARRECQKENYRTVAFHKKTSAAKTNNRAKLEKEEKKMTTMKEKGEKSEKTEKDKVDKRDKGDQEKSEKNDEKAKKSAKDEKTKKNEKQKKIVKELKNDTKEKNDDVTRRSLRSRNVVVMNDKLGKKLKKKCLNNAKEKQKSLVKVKKDLKNVQKSEDIKKEKEENNEEKLEIKGSWEEELFKYKYSLRMPVKLINIARPTNWPKSNGGCSSLPDLDRKETDSDLLNDVNKQKTPQKKNKDETKFSNTKEFKDSVKYLKEKFDKKIEEKNQLESSLTKLMMEKKMKIIPKSSDGPELLPTPSLDGFKSKFGAKTETKKEDKNGKDSCKDNDKDKDKDEVVEESLIG